MGDHVPLQFLLGTRASRYLDPRPRASAAAASTFGSPTAQPLFQPTAHPRSREREARTLLERVMREPLTKDLAQRDSLVDETSHGKSIAPPTALAQLVKRAVICERQLIAEEELSRSCRPRQRSGAHDDQNEANARREEALAFHGYHVENPQFLGVEGLARTPVVVTAQQSEDRRSRKIQRMKLEKRRRKEMQELLREQQEETRAFERRLRERRAGSIALAVNKRDLASDCDLPEPTASAPALIKLPAAAYADQQLTGSASAVCTFVQSSPALLQLQSTSNQCERGCHDTTTLYEEAAILRKEKLELARQQKLLLARAAAPRPSFLATLKLEDSCDNVDDAPPRLVDSDAACMTRQLADLDLSATKSERRRRRGEVDPRDDGDSETPKTCEDREAIRTAKFQRELFTKSEFGGKCLGGGFAVKRNVLDDSSGDTNVAPSGSLEAVLDAQAIRSKFTNRRAAGARRK